MLQLYIKKDLLNLLQKKYRSCNKCNDIYSIRIAAFSGL